MKQFLTLLFSIATTHFVSSQVTSSSVTGQIAIKKADNYTIQRLIIFNDENDILLEKGIAGWMTPALRSNENQSLKEGFEGLAKSIGISLLVERLAGVYTYQFVGLPDHREVSYRTHYTAKYLSGTIIQPKEDGRAYRWMPIASAIDSISNAALKSETNQIIQYPGTIWGGAFLFTYRDDKFESILMTEDFYSLSGNSNIITNNNTKPMAKVTGIGGIFFKCKDPDKMKEWYKSHLGIDTNDYGASFEWRAEADPTKKGSTQWSPFAESSKYFEPSTKEFMINYRVENLEALIEKLKTQGVSFTDEMETYDYGKFIHLMDEEGNKIELWEPTD
ncbi:MAG TPA: hypothetical protein PLP06_08490 [Saprospiraceae bacterium]|nr:hypothetical protein [Saprospiraceae bacterium]